MDILVNVINQKLKIKANTKRLVSGTQKFIRFEFSLDDAWDNLLVFAQFIQDGKAYNDYLDENNSVYLPPEIKDGKFNVLLYGSGSNTIATTNYLTFEVDKNILISDAQSTEITGSLYNKLVNIVKTYTSQSASGAPTLASSSSLMTDPKTIYLYTGSEDNYIKGDWYYFLGGQLQHGGTYGAGVVDSAPTQDSPNAVSSGGVYDALQIVEHQISPTWIEGGSINKSTGEFDGNSDLNWTYTQFYEIPKSSKIRLSVYASGNAAGVAFYDSNKTFISGTNVKSRTNTDLREYNVPTNAVYVRFTNNVASNYHPDTPLIILLSDKTDAIVDKIPQVDATPTQNSTNAVSSGGVYDALQIVEHQIPQVDATPTQNSTNAVSSGGVYDALQIEESQISPTWIEGGYIDIQTGEFVESSDLNWTYTQFYEIPKSSKIRLSVYARVHALGIGFYDSNKTFISGTDVNSKANTDLREYNVPTNAVFVRFTNNVDSNYHPETPLIILLRDKVDTIVDEIISEIPQVDATPTQNSTNAVSSGGVYEAVTSVVDDIDELIEKTFLHVDGIIDTPAIVSGAWTSGGATDGRRRGRTEYLLKFKGSISFGLGDYSKYKFGYLIYKTSDLTQYTNSRWVTSDVANLDFSAYAIGFTFAHLDETEVMTQSELEEIYDLFSISITGQMFMLNEEIETLQSDVASLKSANEKNENNLLPQIGANPFRFNPCYDHLFINNRTDAVIPHESLYHVRLSKKFGFDVIEANVSATSDGVYVVNHLENYKFGNYFHHVDGITDISNTLLSSVTWDWVVQNVRYNSTIAKYQTRPCRLEEFLQECRQQGLIPFITSSDTNVIAIADAYMGKANYIAYKASRENCPHAIIYHWISNLTTKEDILAYCESVGKPFIFGLGNVSDFTDSELRELVGVLHENGYMVGTAYSDNDWHKYASIGFDVNATIRHINRIENGNMCNLNSVFNFSDFEYTNATLSNGVLTFSSAGTIKPKIESINYPFCGFDIEFDMTGTVTIPAVGEQKSSYNLTSDGSYPVFCATPIINGSPAITINVASGTVIRDVYFKASVF